ncbi:MAG: hypothetical protein LBL99_02070 [Holosporaceae bacterium]|jgi:hypothetical protein|nr:hypothetical protein [Holosporaceae bacterium]
MKKAMLLAAALSAFNASATELDAALAAMSGTCANIQLASATPSVHRLDQVIGGIQPQVSTFLDAESPISAAASLEDIKTCMTSWLTDLGYEKELAILPTAFSKLQRHQALVPIFRQIYTYLSNDPGAMTEFALSFADNIATNGGCFQGYRNRMILSLFAFLEFSGRI